MYDLLTSTLLFVLLVPGFALTLPPSGGLTAVIVHAIVFYVVQAFLPQYVPSWGIWIVVVALVAIKVFAARSAAPAY
jgi:hypothetical protein